MGKIRKIIKEENSDAVFLEEIFDKALIGTSKSYNKKKVAAYSTDMVLEILIKERNMGELEAYEYFFERVEQVWTDENEPVFINDFRNIVDVDDEVDENSSLDRGFLRFKLE
jgi:hypothetical protein